MKRVWELTKQEYIDQLGMSYDVITQNKVKEYEVKILKMRSESKKILLHTVMFSNQVTREEYINEYLQWYKDDVLRAIEEGIFISDKVLREYNTEG